MDSQINTHSDAPHQHLDPNDKSSALSKSYRWLISLTFTGALPFAILALLLHTNWLPQTTLLASLFSYAAIILTFLGGIQWGIGLMKLEDKSLDYPLIFVFSVLPSLAAWLMLLLDYPRLQLIGFILCFALVFIVDVVLKLKKLLPYWFLAIRFAITLLVISLLLLSYHAI